jgi:hypothetical protein
VSKRENSSLILQNLKKRELRQLGEAVVPLSEAERVMTATASAPAERRDQGKGTMIDSYPASTPDSSLASTQDSITIGGNTKLKPRERVARSALIVRLDPALHRRLEQVARFNRLTMNDIAIEAIELHLRNFPHPADAA